MNIGFEQNGSTDDFARPVIILKKYNLDACLIVPLTARQKTGRYYFPVGRIDNRDAVAVLSQVRFIDRKRLTNKTCTLDEKVFRSLIYAVVSASFSRKLALKYCLSHGPPLAGAGWRRR